MRLIVGRQSDINNPKNSQSQEPARDSVDRTADPYASSHSDPQMSFRYPRGSHGPDPLASARYFSRELYEPRRGSRVLRVSARVVAQRAAAAVTVPTCLSRHLFSCVMGRCSFPPAQGDHTVQPSQSSVRRLNSMVSLGRWERLHLRTGLRWGVDSAGVVSTERAEILGLCERERERSANISWIDHHRAERSPSRSGGAQLWGEPRGHWEKFVGSAPQLRRGTTRSSCSRARTCR